MNVIITGTSKGIGKELLRKFLNEGYTVWALSRKSTALRQEVFFAQFEKSGLLNLVDVDFSDLVQVRATAENLSLQVENVDVLINNAGVLLNKPLVEIKNEEMENVYRVNVFSPFILIQNVVSKMGKHSRSHIVNIGSMGGVQGSMKFPGLSIYSSSKMAIAGLTECLAEELKNSNISVNCLAIGSVQTEMFTTAFPGFAAQQSPQNMSDFIFDFSTKSGNFMSGKTIPVSISTP